jgi:hypothetical protein
VISNRFPGFRFLHIESYGLHFEQARTGNGKFLVRLINGEGDNIISEVILAGKQGGCPRFDVQAPIEKFLVWKYAGRKANLAVGVRDEALVSIMGLVNCPVKHD